MEGTSEHGMPGMKGRLDNSCIRGELVRQTCANRAVVEAPEGVRHEIRTDDCVTRWIRNSGQRPG